MGCKARLDVSRARQSDLFAILGAEVGDSTFAGERAKGRGFILAAGWTGRSRVSKPLGALRILELQTNSHSSPSFPRTFGQVHEMSEV